MEGILIGVAAFILIGIFHPLVIKAEYHFGTKINLAFLIGGIIFALLSVLVENLIISILLGVTACCSLWSILEIRDQEKRVLRGWFPMNPKRKDYYKERLEEYQARGEEI